MNNKMFIKKAIMYWNISDLLSLMARVSIYEKEIVEDIGPLANIEEVRRICILRFCKRICIEMTRFLAPEEWGESGLSESNWFCNDFAYESNWGIKNLVNYSIGEYFDERTNSVITDRVSNVEDARNLLEKYQQEFDSDYYISEEGILEC